MNLKSRKCWRSWYCSFWLR